MTDRSGFSVWPHKFLTFAVLSLLLVACGGGTAIEDLRTEGGETVSGPRETIFGEGGVDFGGGGRRSPAPAAGIGVNAYLWRASLDTLSVWPIASADPFGGVILTDWYEPPEVAGERFKVDVVILDRALRADGVRVSVFRQVRDPSRRWRAAPVQAKTSTQLEDAILMRARQFRNETLQQ